MLNSLTNFKSGLPSFECLFSTTKNWPNSSGQKNKSGQKQMDDAECGLACMLAETGVSQLAGLRFIMQKKHMHARTSTNRNIGVDLCMHTHKAFQRIRQAIAAPDDACHDMYNTFFGLSVNQLNSLTTRAETC